MERGVHTRSRVFFNGIQLYLPMQRLCFVGLDSGEIVGIGAEIKIERDSVDCLTGE